MAKLKVDMVGILDAMRSASDGMTFFFNRVTGGVDFRVVDDYAAFGFGGDEGEGAREEDGFSNADTWEEVPTVSSREGYDLMVSFAETVDEPEIRALLDTALGGRGAFRRFRDVIGRYPDIEARRLKFERDYLEREALHWLQLLGIDPEYELPNIPVPESPAGTEATAQLELVDLLVFGAPEGKTEVVDGKVTRVLLAASEPEARQFFKKLAREICAYCGIEWRKRFTQGKSVFEMGRYQLFVQGTTLRLLIDVHPSMEKRFSSGWA